MAKYSNVLGILGLCVRDGQIKNQRELINFIKEKKLFDVEVEQWKDPDGDYIWCVFYNGKLNDELDNIIDYILGEDNSRLW